MISHGSQLIDGEKDKSQQHGQGKMSHQSGVVIQQVRPVSVHHQCDYEENDGGDQNVGIKSENKHIAKNLMVENLYTII